MVRNLVALQRLGLGSLHSHHSLQLSVILVLGSSAPVGPLWGPSMHVVRVRTLTHMHKTNINL